MSTAEDRYFEAMDEQRHLRDCGLCLMGRPDLCTDTEDEDDER